MMKIYYMGHSAWAVETEYRYILFDCQDENIKKNAWLSDGYVDISLIHDKPLYMFYSHNHHDHYSRKLHMESVESGIGLSVLGDFGAMFDDNAIVMRKRESKEINGIKIHTASSTDEGVCFFVQTDGWGIFFAGDHADWGDGDAANKIYYDEIDYVAGLGMPCDIAFVPVCTYSGQRPVDMTKGAVYAIEKLNPGITFPMHGNGREHLYHAFENDLRKKGSTARVVCVKEKGEVRVV